MSYVVIPTRTEEDANSAADVNQLMANCEALLALTVPPVNAWYVQYPAAESNTLATAFPTADEPSEIWDGTTWEEYYADEGIFFKTRGDPLSQTDGENNARTTGLQTDALRKHHHSTFSQSGGGGSNSGGNRFDGTMYVDIGIYSNSQYDQWTGKPYDYDTTGQAGSESRVAIENRGRNRFCKIWRRTS